jgi:hypothetical protein
MMNKMMSELFEFWGGEVPPFIEDAGKTYIKVRMDQGVVKITMDDVAKYFANEADNIMSGVRTIAGITGDWRPIDELAHMCLEWFKFVNIEGMRRVSRRYGLNPKF